MKKSLALLIALLSLHTSLVFADSDLKRIFNSTFFSAYEAGRCGDNILGLLGRAYDRGLDLYDANIIEITNKGFSVFGMVNVEYARSSGRLNPEYPARGLRNLPGERNWYHHVVLEKDGLIYDFDFGNNPVVTDVQSYFEKMFLEEKTRAQGGEFYVGREDKLKDYSILIRPAAATLEARRNRQISPVSGEMRLRSYLSY